MYSRGLLPKLSQTVSQGLSRVSNKQETIKLTRNSRHRAWLYKGKWFRNTGALL